LSTLDLAIVALYLVFAIVVGSRFVRKASTGVESFFVGGRRLSWWVAGTSMVATTFAADTPLAVTGIVAADGISGNWIWWCWAIAHVVATFFFAQLWRRSGVITDAEIVELRYGGRPAAALRGFKAIYFGVFINCLTMAWVIAAMVKISRAFFDVSPGLVITICIAASVLYTTLGGFRGVVITDFVQFGLGMTGAIILAFLVVSRMGGIGELPTSGEAGTGLIGAVAESVEMIGERTAKDVLDYVPQRDHPSIPWIYLGVLLMVGWWRYAEGLGYIVQRLAACKNAAEAQAASLWFAVAHNALRPWPWILVGLAALVLYPDLQDREMGYPLMMRDVLPTGVLGLVVASLLAAFMSTIDTHTNWGASYLVRDVYQRFLVRDASPRHYVTVSRLCILLMAILAGITALYIYNIAAVWRFLIALGAGLGSVAAARWYWPRVTVYAEFAALGITTVLAVGLEMFCTPLLFGGENPFFIFEVAAWNKILLIAGASLATWIPVALFGPQNDPDVLRAFARKVRPPGPTWRRYLNGDDVPSERLMAVIQRFIAGLWIVYGTLFGIGDLIFGRPLRGVIFVAIAMALLFWIARSRSGETDAAIAV
jgi:Na+/proline symporter